jgi:hypothetical protein
MCCNRFRTCSGMYHIMARDIVLVLHVLTLCMEILESRHVIAHRVLDACTCDGLVISG